LYALYELEAAAMAARITSHVILSLSHRGIAIDLRSSVLIEKFVSLCGGLGTNFAT
jgi:hypothetical protein